MLPRRQSRLRFFVQPLVRSLVPLGAIALSLGGGGCTSLATGPAWTHASLAGSAPERVKREEAQLREEAAKRAREPKTIGAKHILVMHDKSDRKPENVHRTKEEAKKRAEECLARIRKGADFDEMVAIYSDEPGAAERKGDLGVFKKADMVHAFAEAAFTLDVGQVSEIVETPFGYHIIKRTE
jgi:NIMA-interacting peptidyl-prolyl cis-trans isomerase 1